LAVLGSTFSFIVGCNDTASVDSYLPKTVGFYLPKIVDAKLPLTVTPFPKGTFGQTIDKFNKIYPLNH
jgi:hypothetical protein